MRTYNFLNANGGQCAVVNDCMQSSSLSEFQIARISILTRFPSIFVWSDFGFVRVAWSLQVYYCAEHRSSFSFEASSHRNQSTSDH